MIKTIIFRNTTGVPIELPGLGETVPVSVGSPLDELDLSNVSATKFRMVENLKPLLDSGDITIFDGNNIISAERAHEYLVNDISPDADGFWYGYRRRFNILWNQPNHGFLRGNIITFDPVSKTAKLALADSHENSATTTVVTEIIDQDVFYAGFSGATVTNIDPSVIIGENVLEVGVTYYLSSIEPGKVTKVAPSGAGEIVKVVGVATGVDELIAFTYPGYENETALLGANIISSLSHSDGTIKTPNSWQRTVKTILNDPSTISPVNGDRYLIGPSPVGVWAGKANFIAEYVESTSSWYTIQPMDGFNVTVEDENGVYLYKINYWIRVTGINVYDGVSKLPNSPFRSLSFSGMEVSEITQGMASINNVYGSHYYVAEDSSVSTTNNTNFQNKLTLNVPNVPSGKYRISVSYGWNHSKTNSDFECRLLEDGTQKGELHKQEPKDGNGNFSSTGSSQRLYNNRVFISTFNSSSTHTYELEYKSDNSSASSSIWDVVIEFFRVSK